MSNILTYILQMNDKMSTTLNKVGASSDTTAKKVDKLEKEVNSLNKAKLTGISNSFSSFLKSVAPIALITGAIVKLTQVVSGSRGAYEAQAVAEKQLSSVMRNTMNARQDEIKSILDLASAQQKLGVIGDEVQLSAAQELATYLTKTDSLKKLMPVMNDMLAQQYGLNASQEQAAQIASMLGKVMDGQVGALSRYGYKFDKAQEKVLKFGTEAQRAAVLADVVSSAVGGVNADLAKTQEGITKQQENDLGDIAERIGKTVVSIRAAFSPIVDFFISISNKVMDVFENNQEHIQSVVAIVSGVLVKAFQAVGTVLNWVYSAYRFFVDGLRNGNPVLLAVTSAVIYITTALAAYRTITIVSTMATKTWILITKAAKLATTIWAIAQGKLNAVMLANPVGLIIAGVVALIAVIAFLVIKIDGWGKMWNHTVNGAKLTFQAFTEGVKWYFNTMIDGLMIGLNYIKKGWYSFKEAVGLGDSSENQKMLAQINSDTEARKQAIVGGAQKVVDLNKQALSEFKQAANSLSWNDTSFSDVTAGIKNKLGIASPGIPGTGNTVGGFGGAAAGGTTSDSKAGKDAANSIATGGTKTTNIQVSVAEMGNDMKVYVSDIRDGAQNVRDIILDQLTRALSMAQGQVI